MFYLAHPDGVAVPRIVEKSLAVGYSFLTGALLLVDGDGNFAECGADPAAIAAVSVAPAGTDSTGFVRFAAKEFPPGKMQGIALSGIVFSADYTGTLPDVDGGDYGVVRDASRGWLVDFDEVGSTPVRLVNRLPFALGNIARVFVRFNDSFIQPC